jgi:hypothetical protein
MPKEFAGGLEFSEASQLLQIAFSQTERLFESCGRLKLDKSLIGPFQDSQPTHVIFEGAESKGRFQQVGQVTSSL